MSSVKTVREQQVATARISLGILEGNEEVVEVKNENLKDINTLKGEAAVGDEETNGEAAVGDEETISQNSLDRKSEVCVVVPGEALVLDVGVIYMDYNLNKETIANNNVDSVEEMVAEEAVLKEELSKVVDEKLDEFPHQSLPAIYSVGSSCLARWCEDSVWYRATVDSIDEGLYEVTFLDYGNKVVVGLDNMVATVADIPSDEMEMVDYMMNVASPDRVGGASKKRKYEASELDLSGQPGSVRAFTTGYSILSTR